MKVFTDKTGRYMGPGGGGLLLPLLARLLFLNVNTEILKLQLGRKLQEWWIPAVAVMRCEGPEKDVEDYYQVFDRNEEIQSITESLLCVITLLGTKLHEIRIWPSKSI